MKKLLVALMLTTSFTSFGGEIKIDRYDQGKIILEIKGEEAQEIYNKLSSKEEHSGSFSGGFISSTTKIKRGKDITCTKEKYSSSSNIETKFECNISVDHKGRIKGSSY